MAHIGKEFHLQTTTFTSIIGRLMVGPIVSLFLTGLLYNGVFQSHPRLVLAGLTQESYLQFICIGFLFQNFLNSGYYGFSSRLVSEANGKTLSLLWLAPSRRFLSLLSLNSLEYCRLIVMMIILGTLGAFFWPAGMTNQLVLILWLIALLAIGLILGFLRACIQILDRGYIDWIDHTYLVAIFTSCPYIPLDLFPMPIKVLCLMNPGYHFLNFGRTLSNGTPVVSLPWLWAFIFPMTIFILLIFFWRALRVEVLDKSFG